MIKKIRMRFLIFTLFVLSALSSGAELSFLEDTPLGQCGINSLYLCLKYHKIDVNLKEMYSTIVPDAENNVSLRQLADYVKNKGLYIKAIIKPSAADIEQSLKNDTSMIVQYAIELPDKSKFQHIVGLVKPDKTILLLDYPRQAQEISSEDLVKMASMSDGLFVISPKQVVNAAEFLNFKSLKSIGFYLILLGMTSAIAVFAVSRRKHNKEAE